MTTMTMMTAVAETDMTPEQYNALREAFDVLPDNEKPTAAAWLVMRCGPIKALQIALMLPLAVERRIDQVEQPAWARDTNTEVAN